jgi:hypothetical protein
MSKHKMKAKKWWGHLSSQKFAALIFCVFVLAVVAFFMTPAAFGNLCLAVTGLYTAFVGGRAYSDGQTLKFAGTQGVTLGPGDADEEGSQVRPLPRKQDKKREDDDDDGPEVELHVEENRHSANDDMEID